MWAKILAALFSCGLASTVLAQTVIPPTTGGGGSGSVTSVGSGACLVGGPITTSGTLAGTQLINAQTGTSYTIQASDACKIVTFSNVGAIAVTLPSAAAAGFTAGYGVQLNNTPSSGTATVTPQSGTINGSANLVMPANSTCELVSDGANWQVAACPAAFGGPFLQLAGGTMTGNEILAAGTSTTPSLGMNATNRGFYDAGTTENIGLINAGICSGAFGGAHWMFGNCVSLNVSNNTTAPKIQVSGNAGTAPGNGVAVFSWRAATTAPAALALVQANNTTVGGTKTAVVSGTSLGMIDIEGADGTNFQKSSQILGEVDAAVAAGIVPGRLTVLTTTTAGTLVGAWKVDRYQHVVGLGTAPAVTCGSGATVAGNDKVGRITAGSTPGTTCTVTFAQPSSWVNAPICFAQDETLGLGMPATTVTTSAVTFTLATLAVSNAVSYTCMGYE